MIRVAINVLIAIAVAAPMARAAPIELELATERGVQITAPHEWLQLLTSIGIQNVRIRGAQPGDEPAVTNRGTAQRPRYHVVGVLTAREQLVLPGGAFSRGDRARLKDHFDQLAADGAESLTATRGMFGLTKQEIEAVFADLAQPIDFATQDQLLPAVIDRLQTKLASKLRVDAGAGRAIRAAGPVADELQGVTAGTGLAIMLRSESLVLRPEKARGEPVAYHIVSAGADAAQQPTLGKPDDHGLAHWPVGWQPQQTPGQTAPSLFEFLNVEIEGYTLSETLAAVGPRLGVPLYLDHAALAAHEIDPAAVQVRLPRTRTFYKRVLDRVLSQARLGSQLRVDEAGTPFVWITR